MQTRNLARAGVGRGWGWLSLEGENAADRCGCGGTGFDGKAQRGMAGHQRFILF